jgi:hypothetical protein
MVKGSSNIQNRHPIPAVSQNPPFADQSHHNRQNFKPYLTPLTAYDWYGLGDDQIHCSPQASGLTLPTAQKGNNCVLPSLFEGIILPCWCWRL